METPRIVVQHNAEHEMKNKCYLIRLTRSFLNHKLRSILESAIKTELRVKEPQYWYTRTVYCVNQKLKSCNRLLQHNKKLICERTAPEVSFEWWHARVLSRDWNDYMSSSTTNSTTWKYYSIPPIWIIVHKGFITADAKSKNHNSQMKLKHFSKAVSLEIMDWLDSTSEKRVLTLAVPRGYQNNAVREVSRSPSKRVFYYFTTFLSRSHRTL